MLSLLWVFRSPIHVGFLELSSLYPTQWVTRYSWMWSGSGTKTNFNHALFHCHNLLSKLIHTELPLLLNHNRPLWVMGQENLWYESLNHDQACNNCHNIVRSKNYKVKIAQHCLLQVLLQELLRSLIVAVYLYNQSPDQVVALSPLLAIELLELCCVTS